MQNDLTKLSQLKEAKKQAKRDYEYAKAVLPSYKKSIQDFEKVILEYQSTADDLDLQISDIEKVISRSVEVSEKRKKEQEIERQISKLVSELKGLKETW